MYNQPPIEKPSAAYYVTLIGGILGIIAGIFLIIILVGIWIIIANTLMIVFAQRLIAQPNEHTKYGTYILILSILGGINILCLIGGILALVYQPAPTLTAHPNQTYASSTTSTQPTGIASVKYCPQCGNPVGGEAQYCPKCGKQLPP